MPTRLVCAHFLFAPGSYVNDVPCDPDLYYSCAEITLAIRAFTHGYDLFHPRPAHPVARLPRRLPAQALGRSHTRARRRASLAPPICCGHHKDRRISGRTAGRTLRTWNRAHIRRLRSVRWNQFPAPALPRLHAAKRDTAEPSGEPRLARARQRSPRRYPIGSFPAFCRGSTRPPRPGMWPFMVAMAENCTDVTSPQANLLICSPKIQAISPWSASSPLRRSPSRGSSGHIAARMAGSSLSQAPSQVASLRNREVIARNFRR